MAHHILVEIDAQDPTGIKIGNVKMLKLEYQEPYGEGYRQERGPRQSRRQDKWVEDQDAKIVEIDLKPTSAERNALSPISAIGQIVAVDTIVIIRAHNSPDSCYIVQGGRLIKLY
jgi:hypothetical protein